MFLLRALCLKAVNSAGSLIHTILNCSQSYTLPPYVINKVNVCLHSMRKSDFAKLPRRTVFQGLLSVTCETEKNEN